MFSQKRDQLQDEEERKSSWVSQERQKTLDRLRTFKQVTDEQLFFSGSFLSQRNWLIPVRAFTVLLAIFFHCIISWYLEHSQQNVALVVTNSSSCCIPSAIISFCSLLHLYLVTRHLANVPEKCNLQSTSHEEHVIWHASLLLIAGIPHSSNYNGSIRKDP